MGKAGEGTGRIVVPDLGELGPAMRALPSDRMRAFVIAMHENAAAGDGCQWKAARDAGYAGTDPDNRNKSTDSLKTTGHRLSHDERIQAAMLEEGRRRLGAMVPLGTSVLAQIIQDDSGKISTRDRMKAVSMVLNRTGLPETTEHKVITQRQYSEEEKIERALRLAKDLGLDGRALLGNIGIRLEDKRDEAVVVEAEVVATTEGLEDLL